VLLQRASFNGGDVILKWNSRLSLNLLEEKEVLARMGSRS
jgi:hypothetical protein